MKTIKLTDLPKLPSRRFTYKRSVRWLHHAGFIQARDYLEWLVKDRMGDTTFELLGWTDNGDIFRNREGQIAVLAQPANGDSPMWEHVPIYPEDRAESVFFISEG